MRIINNTGGAVATVDLERAVATGELSYLEKAVYDLGSNLQSQREAPISMFTSRAFSQPSSRQEQLISAAWAARDGCVWNVLNQLEGIITGSIRFESPDSNTSKFFKEFSEDVDLESFMSKAFRELFTYGLFTSGSLWGSSNKKIQTVTPTGRNRVKTKRLFSPVQMSILDINKVIPLSTGPFGTKRLFFQADSMDLIEPNDAANLLFLTNTPFKPSFSEMRALQDAGCTNTLNLFELNPDVVWQHSLTTPDYLLFPDIPLNVVSTTLELKARLLDSDRAMLIGSSNYVLIFKIGTEEQPVDDEEKSAYREGLTRMATLPVIFADHRLEVDILITPTDGVLNEGKHSVIDSKIYSELLGLPPRLFLDDMDPEVVGNLVCGRLNTIRRNLARSIKKNILDKISKASDLEKVNLVYQPAEVKLFNVQSIIQSVLSARQRREISRETYLSALGFNQDAEAQRLKIEEEIYDPTFKTLEPFSGQQAAGTLPKGSLPTGSPEDMGSTGGKPNGVRESDRTNVRNKNE